MKRYQKILLGILITILVILGGIQIYLSFFLEDQLEETATNRFHKATDDAYELTINDLDLWVLGREISVSGIKITKKEKGSGTDIQATLEEFSISGIGILNYLISQNLNLNQIEFNNPEIFLTTPGKEKGKSKDTDLTGLSRKISEAALQELNFISISDISINGVSVVNNRADLPMDTLFSLNNSDIHLQNIEIDSTSLKEDRILPADNLTIELREIRYQTTNGLYNLTADQLEFSSQDSQLGVDSIRLAPKFERVEFANQAGYETDRISLTLDQLSWKGIDTEQLNRAEGISSQHMVLNNIDLDIYHDKRPPPGPKKSPPLPHEMFKNIPLPFSVDSVSITNSNIRYIERHPEAQEPGYIEFADLSAMFKNLSNDEERWKRGENPTLHAETKVMKKALLNVDFSFASGDSSNQQQIKGNLQSMDMQLLNDTLIPLAFVRVENGKILGLDFDMTLGKEQAGGQVTLRYENLKVSLLNKESSSETLGKKVISFLTNEFKLESDNKSEDLRVGEVDFERAKDKSTFNYWWKSLLSGIKSSIGF